MTRHHASVSIDVSLHYASVSTNGVSTDETVSIDVSMFTNMSLSGDVNLTTVLL